MGKTLRDYLSLSKDLYNLLSRKEMIQRQCSSLGRMECELLNYLNDQEEPVSMSDLARDMGVSHSRITRIVDALVRKKLVKRYPSKRDRRSWLAEISNQGRDQSNQTIQDFIDTQNKLIERLPQNEREDIFKHMETYLKIYNTVLDEKEKK